MRRKWRGREDIGGVPSVLDLKESPGVGSVGGVGLATLPRTDEIRITARQRVCTEFGEK